MMLKGYTVLILVIIVALFSVGVVGFSLKEEFKGLLYSDPEVSDSGVADWKVYPNEKYGYRVEYPSGWLVWDSLEGRSTENLGRIIKFGPSPLRMFQISVWENDLYDIDLDNNLIHTGPQEKSLVIDSHHEEQLFGEEATLFDIRYSPTCDRKYVRVKHDKYIYWLFAYCDPETGQPHELSLKMLSSFTFVNPR